MIKPMFAGFDEGTIMSDIRLRQEILDELEYEPIMDAANIGVTVEDGVVTLAGHVHSFAENTLRNGLRNREGRARDCRGNRSAAAGEREGRR